MDYAFKSADLSDVYNLGWKIFKETSADYAMDYGDSLITLRRKSQQLVRDNPIVAGFQQAYINIIAAEGPVIYAESDNKIQERQANELIEEFSDYADITRTKSMAQLIEEEVSAMFVDGDVLVNLPIDGDGTVVELIEAYRIQTPSDLVKNDNIRHGVKYDNTGHILGYYVKKYDRLSYYTNDNSSNFDFYPMFREGRMTTFLFKGPLNSRPSSSRQYPIITPIIHRLKQFDDYYEAQVVACRVAACFAAFITCANPVNTAIAMTTDTEGSAQKQSSDNRRFTKLQPGMVGYLKPGEKPEFASPNRPGDNADDFTVRSCKLMSMCVRLPYIVAFLDTDEVSYSSWRGAVIDTKKLIGRWRRDISRLKRWVYRTKLYEGIVNGKIRGNLEAIQLKLRWPSLGVLDMEKEARGSRINLENQTVSRQMLIDETGEDYDVIEKELTAEAVKIVEREAEILKRQKELEKQYDIVFPENKEEKKSDGEDSLSGAKEGAVDRRKEDGNW